jgi:hypothetical protein
MVTMFEVTAAEKAIADSLGDVWNAYCALPVEHPMEADEFCRGIHALQNMVLARAGCRAINPPLMAERLPLGPTPCRGKSYAGIDAK